MELLTAQKELEHSSEEILLNKLMLLHTVEINRLIIDSSITSVLNTKNQYLFRLDEINRNILELENKLKSDIQIERLGNITSRKMKDKNLVIIISFFTIFLGLVLGVFYVLMRTEYIERKANIKKT